VWDIFKSPEIFYGIDQGIINSTDGKMAIGDKYYIGRSNNNGVIIYHDVIFFDTNSTRNHALLINLEHIHITEFNSNNQTTRMENRSNNENVFYIFFFDDLSNFIVCLVLVTKVSLYSIVLDSSFFFFQVIYIKLWILFKFY
jgi:hypothetical protein